MIKKFVSYRAESSDVKKKKSRNIYNKTRKTMTIFRFIRFSEVITVNTNIAVSRAVTIMRKQSLSSVPNAK